MGGMAPILGQWSQLLGGFDRQLFCYWWHMVPVYGTGQRTNRRGIDLSIGSEYPVLDLSNGTGTGEAIGLIGRVSLVGHWNQNQLGDVEVVLMLAIG